MFTRYRNNTKETGIRHILLQFSYYLVLIFSSQLTAALTIQGQYLPAWRAGLPDGIPDIPSAVSVSEYGAIANDGKDDTLAFLSAIKKWGGEGAISIPEGVFELSAPIVLPSGTVLRGSGSEKTVLEINHSSNAFVIQGSGSGTREISDENGLPKVIRGAIKGSYTIELDDASQFSVGDGIELVQGYEASLHETRSKWGKDWAKRLIGHFSEVLEKNGNQLTLSDKVRIDMNYAQGIWALPVQYVSDVGFEGFSVNRKDKSDTYIFYLKYSSEVWARDIHSQHATKGHFYVAMSRRFELRDSILEFAHSYSSGGHGYGVELTHRTTGALITNNVFNHLRHSMMLHIGANGNVLAYNFSTDPHQDDGSDWIPPDISFHGHYAYSNLVESNMVSEIGVGDYWGPSGPDNVFFRNQITSEGIRGYDHTKRQFVIANLFTNEGIILDDSIQSGDWIQIANQQVMEHKPDLSLANSLPASYYYATPPPLMIGYQWPAFGPDVEPGSLPALDRFFSRNPSSQNISIAASTSDKPDAGSLDKTTTRAPLRCTIIQDNNWKTGNIVRVYLTNTENSTVITNWSVEILFNDESTIDKIWSARLIPGDPAKVEALSWNQAIEPGQTAHFGLKIAKSSPGLTPVTPVIRSEMCQ